MGMKLFCWMLAFFQRGRQLLVTRPLVVPVQLENNLCFSFHSSHQSTPASLLGTPPPPPKRCSIGLRPRDCGGHLRTVNLLSRSRNQFEII